MGFLNMLFGRSSETDDQKELRKYEKSHTPASYTGDSVFIIEDVFYIYGRGVVVAGTVQKGTFHTGDKVIIVNQSGSEIESQISGIELFRKLTDEVSEGENAGILLSDVQKNQIQTNDIIKKECK